MAGVARIAYAILAVGSAAAMPMARADEPAEIQYELDFASKLVEARFPDYAKKVVDRLLAKYPQAKAGAAKVQIEVLTSVGKFDEAEKLVAGMPPGNTETMVMLLAIGDQYYARNKMKEARRVYDSFFKQFSGQIPADIARFYGESAYKFAQMLVYFGDEAGAVEAYRNVLKTKLETDIDRRVKTELAELLFRVGSKLPPDKRKPYFQEAKKIATEIQWGGVDLWFAKTVVILTHFQMIDGDRAGARKTILDYMPMLQQVDEILRENKEPMRLSPMAECRYMLGTLYEEDAVAFLADKEKKNETVAAYKSALKELYTVAIKYPGSSWAPDARKRAEAIVQTLEDMGLNVTRPKLDDMQLVSEQLKEARVLFQQQDYKAATDKYQEVLAISQDFQGVLSAMADLARCYVEQGDRVYAMPVIGFIAERFCGRTNRYEEAGSALLGIANGCEERSDMAGATLIWGLVTRNYPNHSRIPDVYFHQGELALRATNHVAALAYYRQITERYAKSRLYAEAMGRSALCYAMTGDHTNAVAVYTNYIPLLSSSPEAITARLRLADSYRALEQLVPAINEYGRLINAVTQEGPKYGGSPEDVARNRRSMELAYYFKAVCYSRLQKPEDQIPVYQGKAIETYTALLKEFPKSDLAPTVLSSMGTLYFLQKKTEDAGAIFDRLVKEYPEAPQAKNIAFVQGESLMEMGRKAEAVKVFADTLKTPQSFKPAQFLRVGQVLMEAKEYDTAARAFAEALKSTDPAIWQMAVLGYARALAAKGAGADAVAPLEDMIKKYPRSAYLLEANLVLAPICAEIGMQETDKAKAAKWFDKAMSSMSTVRRYSKDPETLARFEVDLAALLLKMGDKKKAAAAYDRIILSMDLSNPVIQPYYEKALEGGIPILAESGRYADIIDNCETYLKLYPAGRLEAWVRQWRDTARNNTAGGPAKAP